MRRVIACLAVVAVALLGACGPQGSEASAQERVAQAAAATQEAGSAKMAMEMKMSGGAQEMTINAEGAFEFESQRGSMTMDLGALGAQMGGGKIEMITDGTILYMKMPNAAAMGVTTPWVKMDLEKMGGAAGMGQLSQLNNNDPSRTLDMLRGVSDDVEEVGTEDVRGTSTTHYKATIDLEKALAETPEDGREALQQQVQTLGTTTLPVDVWIDDEGLLRRQEVTMDLSNADTGGAPAGATPTSMFMRMEMFDFGAEVNVEPPPANQVTDIADMPGAGGN